MAPSLSRELSGRLPHRPMTWASAVLLGLTLVALSLLTASSPSVGAAPAAQCSAEQNSGG